jgi:cyclopropane fatty-acyl-phospholipid synthase-like methyltransferase
VDRRQEGIQRTQAEHVTPAIDKAGVDYWDSVWRDGKVPEPFRPLSKELRHYADASFHRLFERALAGLPPGSRLLEIGCARSRLLPYFASHYGFDVTGIDYSEMGCEQAREMLEATGASGTVVEGDLFDPPAEMLAQFDVVWSLGVVEHFRDVSGCILSMRRFLNQSGRMLTSIPKPGRARRDAPSQTGP